MKELKINLDELAFILHRGQELEMECFLNLSTGDIINIPTNKDIIKQSFPFEEDPDFYNKEYIIKTFIPENGSFLYIPDFFNQHVYDLMSNFTKAIEERNPIESLQLWKAIQHEGGYKKFHDLIIKDKYAYNYFITFRDIFYKNMAAGWLKENEIIPIENN